MTQRLERAVSKLHHLDALADEAGVAARQASEKLREAVHERSRLERPRDFGPERSYAEEQAAKRDKALKRQQRQVERLTQERDGLHELWRARGRVAEACRRFLESRGATINELDELAATSVH